MKISQNLPAPATNKNANEFSFSFKAKSTSSVTPHSDGQSLASALQQMHQMPDIDGERVANAQAMLTAGELNTDSASLAKAMMDFHRS